MNEQDMKNIKDCWLSGQILPYEMIDLLNENPELIEYFEEVLGSEILQYKRS